MIEAFNLGPFLVPTRALILILCLFLTFFLSRWLGKRLNLDRARLKQAVEYTAWSALIGARLGFVLLNWSAYQNTPWEALYIWQPGFSYAGGLVSGAACALWYFLKYIPDRRRCFVSVLAGSYLAAALVFVATIESMELLRPTDLPGVGDIAPDFTLANLSGDAVHLSDLAGRGIILNFWASWCPPCRREMPLLDNIHKSHESEGLSVIGVAIDESPQVVKFFIDSIGVSYPIWVDAAPATPGFDQSQQVFSSFGGVGLPTTLFIDRSGVIRKIYVGELSRGFLQSQAEDLL